MNGSILSKLAIIDRCLVRIRDVYTLSKENFDTDYTSQDSVIFNLQRACEACIAIANITCKQYKIGVPRSGRDSFELMKKAGLLNESLVSNLQAIDDVRNIAVHDYRMLNLDILKRIIEKRLGNFTNFIVEIRKFAVAM